MSEKLLRPGHPRPAVIAHAFGNTEALTHRAIADGADFIEVDLWVHRGRFEARHERRVKPLPLLFEKWYLRWAPRRPYGLLDLVRQVDGRCGILLDFKHAHRGIAELVRSAVRESAGRTRIAASSQSWQVLRSLQQAAPEVDLFYSIDVPAKLDLFLSIADRDSLPVGVSCRASLLTEPVVRRLHEYGLIVVAWTVDDLDRARELLDWGVDGITTHQVVSVHQLIASR